MRPARLGVVLVAVGLLAACGSPDDSPVPTTAAAPWACAGVPQDGVDLILGASATATTHGRWSDESGSFTCTAKHEGSGTVLVIQDPVGGFIGGVDAKSQLEAISREPDAEPIDADATGSGYVVGSTKPAAAWVCGERVLSVELINVDTEGRDGRDDATNLLVSMLPWACDGEAVPS